MPAQTLADRYPAKHAGDAGKSVLQPPMPLSPKPLLASLSTDRNGAFDRELSRPLQVILKKQCD